VSDHPGVASAIVDTTAVPIVPPRRLEHSKEKVIAQDGQEDALAAEYSSFGCKRPNRGCVRRNRTRRAGYRYCRISFQVGIPFTQLPADSKSQWGGSPRPSLGPWTACLHSGPGTAEGARTSAIPPARLLLPGGLSMVDIEQLPHLSRTGISTVRWC
jgi:hypothetical protein